MCFVLRSSIQLPMVYIVLPERYKTEVFNQTRMHPNAQPCAHTHRVIIV